MSSKRKQYKIYGPAHFKATWRKFLEICERENVSASHLVRVWVEGYVARKDPGNPQTTLESHVPGTEDHEAAKRSTRVKQYLDRSILFGGEIRFRRIVDDMKADGVPPRRREPLAKAMATDLEKLGVTIIY